jgi:NarL family two-component system response regulator LiaR
MVERAVAERAEVTPQEATLAEGEDTPAPIRLVIVDDHGLVREGTAQLLKQSADFDVVGQAGSGEDGLAVLERLQPDVALVDVHLPQMSGLELARAAASSCPSVKVLILSAYDDYAYVSEALEIGVGGYLLKTATTKELVDAVRAVADGILVLDRRVADRLTRRGRSATLPGAGLTPREADILPLLARGRSNKQIATELRLGLRTVEGHVSGVLAKLGVASRAEAVAYALSHRLVVPESPGGSSDVG